MNKKNKLLSTLLSEKIDQQFHRLQIVFREYSTPYNVHVCQKYNVHESARLQLFEDFTEPPIELLPGLDADEYKRFMQVLASVEDEIQLIVDALTDDSSDSDDND